MDTKTIIIQLDFQQGPIWISDIETGEPLTGADIVDNDEIVRELNLAIQNMYRSYYEFDTHDSACWFNYDKEKSEKYQMLSLINKLIDRLNKINDGSFIVEDRETDRIKAL